MLVASTSVVASTALLPPPAVGERGHRGLVRRLVAWARAYVGFVRANVAEYDIAEVCHRSRVRPVIIFLAAGAFS